MSLLKKSLLCVAAFAVVASATSVTLVTSAEAGENRWTPIGLGAGTVRALAIDPTTPEGLYAAAASAGLYRSADGTASWSWRGVATPGLEDWGMVVTSPTDPQRLYAATRPVFSPGTGAVYTSADAGATWQELLRRPVGFNAVAVSRTGTLLASGELAEVYRSLDGGATWSLVLQPEFGAGGLQLQLAFDPLAPETAYVGGRNLWKSTDAGATWQNIGMAWPDGQPIDNVTALAFPGTRPGLFYALMRSRIFRSEDAGLTWSGGALALGGYNALAADPTDPDTVYAAASAIFVSHDGGATVTELPSEFPHAGSLDIVSALAVSPASPSTLYAAVDGIGVEVSHDAGLHWSLREQRGLSARTVFLDNFLPGVSGRLYQIPYVDNLLFRSTDRGATWVPRSTVPSGPFYQLTEEAGAPSSLWAATGSRGPLHSTDGGATWSVSNLGIEALSVGSPARGVILAGSCGLYRSADGGRTWTQTIRCVVGESRGLAFRNVTRIGVEPGSPGRVWAEVQSRNPAAGDSFLVLFSQNGGLTWRTLFRGAPVDPGVRSVAAARGVIYLNRGHVLLRSRNAGRSWEVGGPVSDQILSLAVDTANPDLVCIATRRSGVLRSTDGGETWTDANTGLARLGRRWILDVRADPAAPSVFYAYPEEGGVFQIRFTAL